MKRYNIAKLGIKPNTGELLTAKLQSLIDSLPIEGGELYFPRGSYVLSTIFLKSNIAINIAKGAHLLGTDDFNDFNDLEPIDFPIYQDVSHTYFDCSLLVGKNLKNVSIRGKGTIDMRSVWDEENKNGNVHRGAKAISLKECENVTIEGIKIRNATDLAIYFAGSKNVKIRGLDINVYIDGISPDNSKNVTIENCKILSGDDGIVFKSSYNLNRLDECSDIYVRNCVVSSRCNAIKFGTETNGGFRNINIENVKLSNVRLAGICIESVDGAIIDGINFSNIGMVNVNAPLFIHLGDRLRGPEGIKTGRISNINFSNISAKGPYKPYKTIPWNYVCFQNNDRTQDLWELAAPNSETWQFTSNICGLKGNNLENITLDNVHLELYGGVNEYSKEVGESANGYPEVYVYGKILPASGIYFRHIRNLKLSDVDIKTINKDKRETLVFDDVEMG